MALGACLDIETTGLLEPEHRIVEIRIDLIDPHKRKKVWDYEQRINPERNMPAEAQRVHHISGGELLNMPNWNVVGLKVHMILNKAQFLVIHNAKFDFGFLNMEFERIGLTKLTMPVVCTMEEGIWASPTGKKPSLMELCFACGVIYDPALAHAAAYDVDRTVECFYKGLSWGFYSIPAALEQKIAA